MAGEDGAWVDFEAPLQPMPWGRDVCTVVPVPERLAAAASAQDTRRVEGTMAGRPVNLGLNRADVVTWTFVYVGRSWQRRLGLAPGEVVECRLRPADPDEVPLPDDVAQALLATGRQESFEQLRPAQRRRLLAGVEDAATEATRARRVAALVADVPPR